MDRMLLPLSVKVFELQVLCRHRCARVACWWSTPQTTPLQLRLPWCWPGRPGTDLPWCTRTFQSRRGQWPWPVRCRRWRGWRPLWCCTPGTGSGGCTHTAASGQYNFGRGCWTWSVIPSQPRWLKGWNSVKIPKTTFKNPTPFNGNNNNHGVLERPLSNEP